MRRYLSVLLILTLLGAPLGAQENGDPQVQAGKASRLRKLVPAEQLEAAAGQQYLRMTQQAAAQQALAPEDYPQLQRLRRIAARIVPHTPRWNERAGHWRWEVNLIASRQVNAFCMPGGKIAVYTGLLDTLKPTDDEVAMVLGHEIAHALREHARERIAKTQLTGLGANLLSQALKLGDLGQTAVGLGANLLTLRFSREDETDADLVGMDVAARAGYDPRAALTLWRKMEQQSRGARPQWMSTHPAGSARIEELERNLPDALAVYARALKTSAAPPRNRSK